MELKFSEYEALRQGILATAGIIADVFIISSGCDPRIWHSEVAGKEGTYRQLAAVSVSSWDIGALTMIYILTTGVNGINRNLYMPNSTTLGERKQCKIATHTRVNESLSSAVG